MRIYNMTGYSLIVLHVLTAGLLAPPGWGVGLGAAVAFLYLVFVWLVGGVYLSDVLHLGIAHGALDYRPGFVTFITLLANTAAVYVNPVTWVDRHRNHHAFADHPGDPNKRHGDGLWKTLWLCFAPYPCGTNLATDAIFRTWPFHLVSSSSFALLSPLSSYGLLWLVARDWAFALALWLGVRALGLWINMVQNYWTHDRRFGTRRYADEQDNATNVHDWLPVTASFSACLQNNHHHAPAFLRTSHDPAEYDFGFLTVRVMKAMGLVRATSTGAEKPAGIRLQEVGF